MPRSQAARFVFAILVLASLAILAFISRNGYVFLQEIAFQNAAFDSNDDAAATALQRGAFSGQRQRLQLLCDTSFRNNRPKTVAALMQMGYLPHDGLAPATIVSAATNCPDVISLFLDRGAPIDTRDTFGRTALMVLVKAARADLARMLLDRGADLNARDQEGNTALMSAGTVECARLLLERGADVDASDTRGATTLAFRTREGNLQLVEFLLSKGARLETRPLRPNVLADALRVGRVNTTRPNALSPAQQARVNERSVRMSPLCEAVCGGRLGARSGGPHAADPALGPCAPRQG